MNVIAEKGPLVDRFVPGDAAGRVAALFGLAIVGSLILWASAKVHVPFWPVPMTLQTGAVALIAAAYGSRLGLATVVLYLLEGAIGIPVFSATPERGIGLPYMLGTTGGFLVGFAVEAFVIGWLAERGLDRNPLKLFGVMILGDAIVFVLGVAWLAWFAALASGAHGIGLAAAFSNGVVPFVLGDIVKLALAAALVSAGARLVRR